MIIPLLCGPTKMQVYDPEINQTACYRYTLIEVEQASLPALLLIDDFPPDYPESQPSIKNAHKSAAAHPSILDVDAAGGAYGPVRASDAP